jgi:hypothetical protein
MSTLNLVYIAKVTHRVLIQCKWHHSRPKPEIDHNAINVLLEGRVILNLHIPVFVSFFQTKEVDIIFDNFPVVL